MLAKQTKKFGSDCKWFFKIRIICTLEVIFYATIENKDYFCGRSETITSPTAYLDERDAVLHAEGCHQLLVHGLVAVLAEHAQQGLSLVQRLGALAETAGQAVSNQRLLQHILADNHEK